MEPSSNLPQWVELVLWFSLSVPRVPSLWVFHYYLSNVVFLYAPGASAFISYSFSASMRADMPCFTGTNLARLVATSCYSLYSCSALICLNPKALYTSCILIGLQHPS